MRRLLKRLEALLAAVAFAEEGEVETARRMVADAGGDERSGGAVQAPEADDGQGRRVVRLERLP